MVGAPATTHAGGGISGKSPKLQPSSKGYIIVVDPYILYTSTTERILANDNDK